ncbi:DUF3040 domain-containing protein [Nonomuraea africana]|uniref:DUF3040 domain-containing protein n=1 Tax=Nonomuraea africana TaxID=46171 RepID=A0ABR9KHK6_9ACTN|nr:DUF3040 domain-containing protein [Nonomuraea africana]MBE1561486.1 hypothetical protein [Nonomuraea africana]
MALSDRERQVLDGIARQLAMEDPAFARSFAEHGEGLATAERGAGRRDTWPAALIAVCLALFAVVLLVSGSPRT